MSGYLFVVARQDALEFLGLPTTLTGEALRALKYGVLPWLVWLPLIGIASMTAGTAVVQMFRRGKELYAPLWYSVLAGILYAACFFFFLLYLPTREGAGMPSVPSSQRNCPRAGGG